MICSSCGTTNEAGRKFCGECGTRLAVACPNCGTANAPTAKFCGECATPLAGATAPAAGATTTAETSDEQTTAQDRAEAASAVAERRLVSILFADLVGFTTFSEGRDAEEVRETLSRYFELASDVIGRHGGTIEKFIGDAVMAVWGAPVAREDDAERAVRAGLDLIGAIPTLGAGIQARAGILTGEAAVTIGATNQGMVAGDLVNTASRLQSVAPPGSVLVGDATHRAASRAIAFEEAGEQVLKGKTSPVPAWRALRIVAGIGGRDRSETLEAPFVGRDDELRLLGDLLNATRREGRARLVSIIGPAGIGKTRLAQEFLRYVDGLAEDIWYHEGRSPAYGDGISFWALGEMIRRRAGLLETDDEATTRAAVAATLAEHVPDADERRWIEPALLSLLGFETGVRSEQLFGAWRTFFERLAATDPVVLVFEDFHFADSGLVDFVDHLMEWSRQVPIYVVTLSRPELLDKRPDWGAGKRNFTSLYLDPLPPAAMRELLTGLIVGLPEPAVEAIVARADGIPLYAVETVRMLVADGKLVEEGGAYRPKGDLRDLAVPETLTALIASRLDALDPVDRTLLQDGAVLGQSFTLAGLTAVAALPEGEVETRLRSLTRRELLRVEADPQSPERGQYVFVQALIREVAYNILARADRKSRHLAAARYFEALGSDELAGALAGHYLAAVANSPSGAERDALAVQARLALRGATERAASLGAHDQAIRFAEQALTISTEPADLAIFHRLAGESADDIPRIDAVNHHFRAAIEALRATGDRSGEAGATARYARALLNSYNFEQTIPMLTAAIERFADLPDDPDVIRLSDQYARALYLSGDSAESIPAIDGVLARAERLDLVDLVANGLVTRGSALDDLGRAYEGAGAIEAGLRLARSHGFGEIEARAMTNLSAHILDDDPRAGLALAREGLELERRIGTRSFQMTDIAFSCLFRLGEWDTALALVEPLIDEDTDSSIRGIFLADVADIRGIRGGTVDDLIAAIEALPDREDVSVKRAMTYWSRARQANVAGNLAEAREQWMAFGGLFDQFKIEASLEATRCDILAGDAVLARSDFELSAAAPRRGRLIEAERRTCLGGIAAIEGRVAESLAHYRVVLASLREIGAIWDEALCAIDMATVLDPDDPEVRAAADAGRVILTRLGATPFLAQLDAAMSRDVGPRSPSQVASPAEVATS